MKISKLFHWLYGVIMLLPIFAIGVTSLVSTFNMSAKQESEIHYKYETNEVNTVDDLVENNIYKLNLTSESLSDNSTIIAWVNDLYIGSTSILINVDKLDNYQLRLFATNTGISCALYSSSNVYIKTVFSETLSNLVDVNFVYFNYGNSQFINYISYTDFNVFDYVETHNLDTQEVFYRAIDKVQQSPLFNWAYNSFLVTPFAYIVSLFSMPTNSFVVMLLSYWLAISIIWLVFDLVMYVPLLIHRWIDKGVLE